MKLADVECTAARLAETYSCWVRRLSRTATAVDAQMSGRSLMNLAFKTLATTRDEQTMMRDGCRYMASL
jgi:hypothetical protein